MNDRPERQQTKHARLQEPDANDLLLHLIFRFERALQRDQESRWPHRFLTNTQKPVSGRSNDSNRSVQKDSELRHVFQTNEKLRIRCDRTIMLVRTIKEKNV